MSSNYQRHEYSANETGQPQLNLVHSATDYERFIKPILDRILGLVLLVLISPVLLLGAAAVWLSMGRPVIFRQKRIGRHGKTFELYKLRTMTPDRRVADTPYTGPDRRKIHKSKEDPRIPRVGAVLRAVRIDELPQFWNVLKGDMSLVGPRPELPEIVARYEDWQHRRHDIKPGLTGTWQISSSNGLPMHECTDLDIDYLSKVSFGTDMSILIRTPFAMVRRMGY